MGIRNASITLSLIAALSLSGCAAQLTAPAEEAPASSPEATQPRPVDEILSELGLDTSHPVQLVEALDALPLADRPSDLIASVLPNGVKLQPGQPDEVFLPIESNDFYLSIAPYVTQTHPCTFHSLTTCVGKMQSTAVELIITDVRSGEVVLSEQRTTEDNGFTGVWLPREGQYSVRINSAQGSAEQLVSTGSEDPSCLTTMQLT